MPFYNRLSIQDNDSDERKTDKKRIADNLLDLGSALHKYIKETQ